MDWMGNTTGMTSFVCDHASLKWILSIGSNKCQYLNLNLNETKFYLQLKKWTIHTIKKIDLIFFFLNQTTYLKHMCWQHLSWVTSVVAKYKLLALWELLTTLFSYFYSLRRYCTPGPYFWRLRVFSQKIKQLRTKYPMDLVRNVPRNSKTTVLLQ